MTDLKSGSEIVKEFFDKIMEISELTEDEKKIAKILKELYDDKKLTETQLKNFLDGIIEEEVSK